MKKIIDITIPTLGKGLQEVRVVSLFKETGEQVTRDELLFSVETDKSAVDVESLYTGTLLEWLVEEDDILNVRDVIARMEVAADVTEKKVAPAPEQRVRSASSNPEAPAAPATKHLSVMVPTLGQGIQDARIVNHYKRKGETVARDEVLFSLETDKATADVVSPYSGTLTAWLVEEGALVPVRTAVVQLQVAGTTVEEKAPPEPEQRKKERATRIFVVPKARALCREHGISKSEMQRIPARGKRLKSSDVTRYLDQKQAPQVRRDPREGAPEGARDVALPKQQQVLNFRFRAGLKSVIPATIFSEINAQDMGKLGKTLLEAEGRNPAEVFVSDFAVFAHVVAKVLGEFPKFRSILLGDSQRREYDHVNLGLAVQRGEDLATAVVAEADTLDFGNFVDAMQNSIDQVFGGADQAGGNVPFLLTYMGHSGVLAGVPLLPAPATGILAFGSPQRRDGQTTAWLSLTFDHRLLNGLEAASFLQKITDALTNLRKRAVTPTGSAEVPAVKATPAPTATPQESPGASQQGCKGVSKAQLLLRTQAMVAELLDEDPEDIALDESLGVLGMTSIMGLRLKTFLEGLLGEELPATLIWRHPTVAAVVDYCANSFTLSTEDEGTPGPGQSVASVAAVPAPSCTAPAGDVSQLLSAMEGLSQAEIEALLGNL